MCTMIHSYVRHAYKLCIFTYRYTVFVCVCTYMHVCLYVFMYIHTVFVCVCTYMQMCVCCICLCIYTQRSFVCVCTYLHMCVYKFTYIHTAFVCVCTYTHVCVYMFITTPPKTWLKIESFQDSVRPPTAGASHR